jgi:hypothetical protein
MSLLLARNARRTSKPLWDFIRRLLERFMNFGRRRVRTLPSRPSLLAHPAKSGKFNRKVAGFLWTYLQFNYLGTREPGV